MSRGRIKQSSSDQALPGNIFGMGRSASDSDVPVGPDATLHELDQMIDEVLTTTSYVFPAYTEDELPTYDRIPLTSSKPAVNPEPSQTAAHPSHCGEIPGCVSEPVEWERRANGGIDQDKQQLHGPEVGSYTRRRRQSLFSTILPWRRAEQVAPRPSDLVLRQRAMERPRHSDLGSVGGGRRRTWSAFILRRSRSAT